MGLWTTHKSDRGATTVDYLILAAALVAIGIWGVNRVFGVVFDWFFVLQILVVLSILFFVLILVLTKLKKK